MSKDADYYDQLPDFGQELSDQGTVNKTQALTDLAIINNEFNKPKGVLDANRNHGAIVLRADISNLKGGMNGKSDTYHCYVPTVHSPKGLPLILLASKSALFERLKTKRSLAPLWKRYIPWLRPGAGIAWGTSFQHKALDVVVAGEFNDSTSIFHFPKGNFGTQVKPGTMVDISYGNCIGGVPGKGEILDISKIDGAPQILSERAINDLNKSAANTTSITIPSAPAQRRSVPPPGAIKIPSARIKVRNNAVKSKAPTDCREYLDPTAAKGYFNYTGDLFWFKESCADFKTCMKHYQAQINSRKAWNLLGDRKNLGDHFRKLLPKKIPAMTPYLLAARAEFTPDFAYTGTSYSGAKANRRAILDNKMTVNGVEHNLKLSGKSFTKYWTSKGFTSTGGRGSAWTRNNPTGANFPRFKDAFDCVGIAVWLAAESGFVPATKEDHLYRNTGYRQGVFRGVYGTGVNEQKFSMLFINIEQYANTPGASAFTKSGHSFVSAGKGFKKLQNDVYEVLTYEAAYYQKNTRKKNKYFKYKSGKKGDPDEILYVNKDGSGSAKITLGILRTMLYANWSGDFIKK